MLLVNNVQMEVFKLPQGRCSCLMKTPAKGSCYLNEIIPDNECIMGIPQCNPATSVNRADEGLAVGPKWEDAMANSGSLLPKLNWHSYLNTVSTLIHGFAFCGFSYWQSTSV